MKDLKNPIIIGGCGSSGTTLLRKMLNAHPNIACGPEMSVFDRPALYDMDMSLFYTLWRNADFEELEEGCIFPIRSTNNGSYFAFHREQYHNQKETDQLFNEAENPVEFFRLYFSLYAEKQGKKRWAEKTPNNIFCIEQIFKAMPDAKFIEVVRDGRDVVLSLVERRKMHPMIAIFRWLASTGEKLVVSASHFLIF